MKKEKQIYESKQLITQALVKLLQQKTISLISMTEIADEAGVARMTLYRYFKSKEEIILYIVETKVKEYINRMENDTELTLYDFLLFRFQFFKISPFTNMLYECNYLSKVLSLIRTNIVDKLLVLSHIDNDIFLKNFFIGGIDRVTEVWISDGMQLSPKEMANKTYMLIKNINTKLN